MQEFEGKVAVISGGGGVLGLALGQRFASAGMKIVLADLDGDFLADSEATLRDAGATVLGVQTDVSQSASVQNLADRAVEAFGGVHVLCNNVGINTRDESLWTTTEADWQWALGANLWGTIHAIRIFVRDTAGPSAQNSPRGCGGCFSDLSSTHNSAVTLRLLPGSSESKVRAPDSRMFPSDRYSARV